MGIAVLPESRNWFYFSWIIILFYIKRQGDAADAF